MAVLPKFAALAASTLAFALAGCGGSEPAPKDASLKDTAPRTEQGPGIVASAEIGGMNEEAVDAAFNASVKGLQRCLDAGAKRVEFLGGSVNFFLKIDATGKVSRAYLEHSTLGSRTTERCMLDSLAAKSWPKPVGGQHGF